MCSNLLYCGAKDISAVHEPLHLTREATKYGIRNPEECLYLQSGRAQGLLHHCSKVASSVNTLIYSSRYSVKFQIFL